jgi:hypothetical protein
MRTIIIGLMIASLSLQALQAKELGRSYLKYYDSVEVKDLTFSFDPKTRTCTQMSDQKVAKNFFEDKDHKCEIMSNDNIKGGIVFDCRINNIPKIWIAGSNKHVCEKTGKIALFALQLDNKRRGVKEWKQF